MRVEAVSWDDWSASNAPPTQDADKWHVAVAPDDVKIVSLEQLDDLFRLSIVDAETKVWQAGMTEWMPLRVIAGIDDDAPEPPEPKRTHPKPPSPRSAPPPPRPPSRAPVAQAARAPVYAEPLAFAQTQAAFVAPVVPQFTSVRPLVVSQPPRVASGGGGFGRFLVGLALLGGVSVTLYRNDVVRDAAHSLHQDGLYTRLQASLGGPSFGTLASLERAGSASDRSTVSSLSAALAAPTTADEPTSAATPDHDARPAPSPVNTGSAPPVVSLESLKPESATGAKVTAAAASREAPAPVAKPAAQPKPQAAPASAAPAPVFKAAVAKSEPVAKAAPAAKAAPVEKAPPPKNEADMTPRERLNAAISASMMSSPPTPKKGSKSKASEYDPLNPKL